MVELSMTTSRCLTDNRGRSWTQLHTYYLVTPVFWRAEISDLWQQVKMTTVASRFVGKTSHLSTLNISDLHGVQYCRKINFKRRKERIKKC